jgi:hypothetical protein
MNGKTTRWSPLSSGIAAGLVALAISPGVWACAHPHSSPPYPVAEPDRSGSRPIASRLVEVALVDDNGALFSAYRHRGRNYVAGEYGDRYAIAITNRSSERIEVVVSVDGRDAISGDVANYRHQRGYIVAPYATVTVDGFRRSLEEVAAFRFTDHDDSYSAQRGTPENVGVIGVAVFREVRRRAPLHYYPYESAPPGDGEAAKSQDAAGSRRSAAPSAPSGSCDIGQESEQSLGTQYGESRTSRAAIGIFERRRSRRADEVLAIYYDSEEALAARGVPVYPTWKHPRESTPEPFPGVSFAPAPADDRYRR